MRDSIWSAPAYEENLAHTISLMEEGWSEEERVSYVLNARFAFIPGDTWQAKLDNCAGCKCCPRHQERRPSWISWPFWENPSSPKIHNVDKDCECNCRHLARFICRQVIVNCNDDRTMPPCPRSAPIIEDIM